MACDGHQHPPARPAAPRVVLQTLQEIAAALQYLHRNDVLHGDLTGGNVLLTASDKDTRGFTAKVHGCCICVLHRLGCCTVSWLYCQGGQANCVCGVVQGKAPFC